jgi:hypothetical protein
MTRKQAKGKADMNATPTATEGKLRAVRLELSEPEHAALRIEAAKQDTSLAHLARVAVREYLSKRKAGGT